MSSADFLIDFETGKFLEYEHKDDEYHLFS